MNDSTKSGEISYEDLDLSDLGNLTPVYSNRFYAFVGPVVSRIFFGELMKDGGDHRYHTSVVLTTADIILLRDLLDRLIQKVATQESQPDG